MDSDQGLRTPQTPQNTTSPELRYWRGHEAVAHAHAFVLNASTFMHAPQAGAWGGLPNEHTGHI